MSQFLRKFDKFYLPLWRRKIPRYPLYYKGNPQHRIFLPLFWMKLLNHEDPLPPGQLYFRVHPQMTQYDVKNYLIKIYDVPVSWVKLESKRGKERKSTLTGNFIQYEDDEKHAFVQMNEGETFEFPDLFKKDTDVGKQLKQESDMMNQRQIQNTQDWHEKDIPPWYRK